MRARQGSALSKGLSIGRRASNNALPAYSCGGRLQIRQRMQAVPLACTLLGPAGEPSRAQRTAPQARASPPTIGGRPTRERVRGGVVALWQRLAPGDACRPADLGGSGRHRQGRGGVVGAAAGRLGAGGRQRRGLRPRAAVGAAAPGHALPRKKAVADLVGGVVGEEARPGRQRLGCGGAGLGLGVVVDLAAAAGGGRAEGPVVAGGLQRALARAVLLAAGGGCSRQVGAAVVCVGRLGGVPPDVRGRGLRGGRTPGVLAQGAGCGLACIARCGAATRRQRWPPWALASALP